MGKILSILKQFQQKESKVLLIGLDGAGKTAILYKLLGENIQTIPTIGFNVEKVKYGKINFIMWDIGGQDVIRELWRIYYNNNDAVIFVVDSNDKDRLEFAFSELKNVLNNKRMDDVVVLVFANKQDLPFAMTPDEILTKLKKHKIRQTYYVQGCCGLSGEGLADGLNWVSKNIKSKTFY